MKARIRISIQALLAALILFSAGFSQGRQAGKKAVPARTMAPFLQYARSYEETSYVTRVVLKNGTTVLVNEFRAQPVVSIQAHIGAGILDEPPQRPGVASLLAAMVCRGTPDKVKGTLRQNVHALGGLINCAAGLGSTKFEIIAPSSQWKKALDSLIEALLNPYIHEQEMKLEAGILAGEARKVLDDPGEFASGRLFELGFNQPRLNNWRILGGEDLYSLTPASLEDFYKAVYVPEKIMLVISGDVSSGEVLNEIVKIYKWAPAPGAKAGAIPFETRQERFRYAVMEGRIPFPRLLFGFHAVPANSADSAAIQVLSAILGMGEGSILAVRLRDQKKLVLAAETRLTLQPKFGYLTVQMEVKPENIDRSGIALLTEMELLKREGPGDADMERALAQLEHAYWTNLETVTARADSLARFESMGDWKLMDRRISELRQVKAADIRRVAGRYLRLDNCSLVEYLPLSAEKRKPAADAVRNTLEGLLNASAGQEQAERNKETVLALKIPRDAGGFKFSEIRYPFQTASILRGPDMFIREDHTSPVIDMGIFFPGGKPAEHEGNYGITNLLTRMMLRGAGEKSAAQFHRQLEIYGGKVRPVVAADYFGFYFSILSRNFDAGFKLLLEAIKAPNLDKNEIARQKEIQSAEALWRRNSADYAGDLMRQALFRNFFYSADAGATGESQAAIDQASLQSWYDAHVKNRKPVVVAVGDTKGTSLASYFVQNFSGSRMQDGKIPDEYAKALEKG